MVSWGWIADRTFTFGSDYLNYLQWLGTDDPAAYFSVPAAIQFQADYDWPSVRAGCRQLLRESLARIEQVTGQKISTPATKVCASRWLWQP